MFLWDVWDVCLPFLCIFLSIFIGVLCVLGVNWGPASGSECSNKQALLNRVAEGGWGQAQKLSQCAQTERFSGNTSASEK